MELDGHPVEVDSVHLYVATEKNEIPAAPRSTPPSILSTDHVFNTVLPTANILKDSPEPKLAIDKQHLAELQFSPSPQEHIVGSLNRRVYYPPYRPPYYVLYRPPPEDEQVAALVLSIVDLPLL